MAMIAAGLALPGHIILFGDVINEFVFHELAETFMNDVDHFLMSEIISMLLGNGSVVYDECIIDCQELPHGVIDIVGGRIRNKTVDVSIGRLTESMGRFVLHDPTGISAKIRETLYTTSLSKYVHYICCKFKLPYF